MTSGQLRLILILIGMIILIAIYIMGRKRPNTRQDDVIGQHDFEENLETIEEELEAHLIDDAREPQIGLDALQDEFSELDEIHMEEAAERTLYPQQEEASSHDKGGLDFANEKIVVLHIAARAPQQFSGQDILKFAKETSLEFDNSQIFRRVVERHGRKHTLFNMANMVNPGVFNPKNMSDFKTPGLTLFMTLPGPLEGLKSFNAMLDCAQRLAASLSGELLDDTRSALTNQTIDHLRDEIQLFSLRHSKIVSEGG